MLPKMPQTFFGSFEGDWYEVREETQARLLTDTESCKLLAPFIGFERSATQAALEIGCSLERLLYRIKQFERAGLLRETRRERRPGRPIRYYRAVADGFLIPFRLTPFADLETLMAHQSAPFERLRHQASARNMRGKMLDGRVIYRDANTGELHSETALRPDKPLLVGRDAPGNDVTDVLQLEPRQALEFLNELNALYRRIHAARLPDGKGQAFLVQFALVALAPEDSM